MLGIIAGLFQCGIWGSMTLFPIGLVMLILGDKRAVQTLTFAAISFFGLLLVWIIGYDLFKKVEFPPAAAWTMRLCGVYLAFRWYLNLKPRVLWRE